jgi:hypothetical protein
VSSQIGDRDLEGSVKLCNRNFPKFHVKDSGVQGAKSRGQVASEIGNRGFMRSSDSRPCKGTDFPMG